MFIRPGRRLGIAFMVVLALLFSQLALANYVCPTAASHEDAVMEMAPGEPCEGMAADPVQPALCYHHCADAPQSFDAVKVPAVSLPALVQVLPLPLVLDRAEVEAQKNATGEAHPPPEPVFLSTLRLRV